MSTITTRTPLKVAQEFVLPFVGFRKLEDADLEGRLDVQEGLRQYVIAYDGRFAFMLSLYRGAVKGTLSIGQLRGAANVLRAELAPKKGKGKGKGARAEDPETRAFRQIVESIEGDGSYAPTWEDAQDYFDR
ncbi:MAG: hypothetical protein EBS64_07040 [Verrucomicrobia bacterium]|nr:hypothetical protein [Verrucomicrobiota bacterium]